MKIIALTPQPNVFITVPIETLVEAGISPTDVIEIYAEDDKVIHSILDKIAFKKLCAMAALFGVSKSALAIRLQKKGMLGEYIFAGYENLLDIFPETEESVA